MGKGKKLRDEDGLLEYIRKNPKSVKWPDLEWLLRCQGWSRRAKGRRGSDWVYMNEGLSRFRDDKDRRGGKQAPVDIISFGKPHSGKDSMNRRDIERILPSLEEVARLRKETKDADYEQDI
ncbi:MAG: hypothetical protein JW759_09685 [Candidatus Coatesbacteria bacterium]|nr:hypothetical protein [Candidatus Coatesbacteria bacterium]